MIPNRWATRSLYTNLTENKLYERFENFTAVTVKNVVF
jgi:hypothetical protein